ncbi:unnamed protein product [Symbiodinium sp. KB8]|nr:unnamed protein product [Symbiodinium sp. KB8]
MAKTRAGRPADPEDFSPISFAGYGCPSAAAHLRDRYLKGLVIEEGAEELTLDPGIRTLNSALAACGAGNEWCWALHLFDQAQQGLHGEPNVVTYNSAIAAVTKADQWRLGLQLFAQLASTRGLQATAVSFTAGLTACARGELWQSALGILAMACAASLETGAMTAGFNAAANACIQAGRWEEGLSVALASPSLDEGSWALAVFACKAGNCWEQALRLLGAMEKAGVQPTVAACSAAIASCDRQWEQALQILVAMQARGPTPNFVVFSAAIGACSNASEWIVAQQLGIRRAPKGSSVSSNSAGRRASCAMAAPVRKTARMLQSLSWRLGRKSCHRLVQEAATEEDFLRRCCMEVLLRSGAMHYSRLARKAAVLVRRRASKALKKSQDRTSSPEDIRLRLLASLPRSWLSATGPVVRLPVVTAADDCCICLVSRADAAFVPCGHGFVCEACALRCSDCPFCRETITEVVGLRRADGQADDRTLGLFISPALQGFARYPRFQLRAILAGMMVPDALDATGNQEFEVSANEQLGLLEDVRRSSMQAGAIPAVISAFERSGQWEWALHVLTACRDMGFHEDLPSLNAAISSLGQRWQRAAELFAGIQAESLQPDIITLAAMTTSFGTSDRWECVLALGRLMQNRLESNVVSAGATITALHRGSQWESAVYALQRMPQTALQPNIVACNAGLGAAERGARAAWDQALSLQEKLRRFGQRLDVVSFNSAASVCSLERRWDVALALLHVVPEASMEAGESGCNIAIHACEKVGRWREVINTRDAIAAFDAVLDQKLAALRVALMEEHRRLLHVSDFEVAKFEMGSRRSSVESGQSVSRRSSVESGPSGSRRSSMESSREEAPPLALLASSQLETFPRAPPSLNDWFEDEPEEPPADIPEHDSNRTGPDLSSSASSLSTSNMKDSTPSSLLPHSADYKHGRCPSETIAKNQSREITGATAELQRATTDPRSACLCGGKLPSRPHLAWCCPSTASHRAHLPMPCDRAQERLFTQVLPEYPAPVQDDPHVARRNLRQALCDVFDQASESVFVATDGSADVGVAAWSAFLPQVNVRVACGLQGEDQTPVRAEVTAIEEVLQAIKDVVAHVAAPCKKIVVACDCKVPWIFVTGVEVRPRDRARVLALETQKTEGSTAHMGSVGGESHQKKLVILGAWDADTHKDINKTGHRCSHGISIDANGEDLVGGSKTKTERLRSGHAGKTKRLILEVNQSGKHAMDVELGAGSVWMMAKLVASATRTRPKDAAVKQGRAPGTWIGIQQIARCVVHPATRWQSNGRRKANDIGVWLRQVIRIRLLICSARLSTGVSDATAEEAYHILSLRHPTSMQCGIGSLQHMLAMDPGNRPAWAAFANHGESRLSVLRAREVWIPTACRRSVTQIAEGSYKHIGGDHERLSIALNFGPRPQQAQHTDTRPRVVTGTIPSQVILNQIQMEKLATEYRFRAKASGIVIRPKSERPFAVPEERSKERAKGAWKDIFGPPGAVEQGAADAVVHNGKTGKSVGTPAAADKGGLAAKRQNGVLDNLPPESWCEFEAWKQLLRPGVADYIKYSSAPDMQVSSLLLLDDSILWDSRREALERKYAIFSRDLKQWGRPSTARLTQPQICLDG